MITTVIKSTGEERPFDEDKLRDSIAAATSDAGIPAEEASEIVEAVYGAVAAELGEKEQAATSELRDAVLRQLDERAPSAARAWRSYEEGKE